MVGGSQEGTEGWDEETAGNSGKRKSPCKCDSNRWADIGQASGEAHHVVEWTATTFQSNPRMWEVAPPRMPIYNTKNYRCEPLKSGSTSAIILPGFGGLYLIAPQVILRRAVPQMPSAGESGDKSPHSIRPPATSRPFPAPAPPQPPRRERPLACRQVTEGSKINVPPDPTAKLDPSGRAAALFTISVPASTLIPPP